jgi:glycosyltransferase involved in cell wall biosynthesis
MKVLHLTSGVSASSQAYTLHKELLSRGVDSKIICVRSEIKKENIHEISFLDKVVYSLTWRTCGFIAYLVYGGGYLDFSLINLRKYVEQVSPDLIHVHVGYAGFLSSYRLKKIDEPIICTSHDLWHFNISHPIDDSYLKKRPFLSCGRGKNKTKRYLSIYKTIVFPSWYALNKTGIEGKECFQVIANIVPSNGRSFTRSDEKSKNKKLIVGISATRNTPEKGFDRLSVLQAKFNSDIDFVSCGSVEIEGVVKKWPHLDRNQMHNFFSSVDAILVPSRFESFSQVCIEALMHRKPVLLLNPIGCVEYLEDWMYKIIKDDDDSFALIEFISQYQNKYIGDYIESYMRRHFESNVTSYMDVYHNVLNEVKD